MALRATATLAATAPVIDGVPTISGTAVAGQTLTATPAGVTGNPTPARTWQWRRSGTPISGATAATYDLVAADVGATLTVVQTETNQAGSDTAESSATGTVTDVTPFQATIELLHSPATLVAPAGFKFGVTLGTGFVTTGPGSGIVRDDRMHEVYYHWDFGAADAYDYTAPAAVISIGAHHSSRYAYGPQVTHVFRTTGAHRISCRVVEPASGADITIYYDVPTILTEAQAYPANNQTLILDSTGAGLAAYPNATVVTSVASAITTLNSLGNESDPRQIIVRRGQSFTVAAGNLSRGGSWGSTLWRASSEAGADPIFNMTDTLTWRDTGTATPFGGTKDITFKGIDFRGPWDSTTETGSAIVAFNILADAPPKQITFDDCRFAGFEHVISHTAVTAKYEAGLYLNDTIVTDWRFYGLTPNGIGFGSYTGCSICQHVDANAGGTKQTSIGYFNNHSGLRQAKNKPCFLHSCDFFSRNAWDNNEENVPNPDTPLIWGQQPNLRYDTDGLGGGLCLAYGNVWQGGNNVITFATEQSFPNKPGNIIIDKNYFLGGHTTRKIVTLNKGGTTFRNNILIIPDTPKYDGYDAAVAINSNWDELDTANRDEKQRFYSNTIINLSTINAISATEITGWTDVVAENNLFHQPNVSPVTTTYAPLDTTQAFTPLEKGYKHNVSYFDVAQSVLQTAYATPGSSVWRGAPLTGSAALNAATTGLVAWDDFFGDERDGTPNLGAI